MKRVLGIVALAAGLALTGCHQHGIEPDYQPPLPPTGLWTSTGDNFIELFWKDNYESDLAGYNVFVSSTAAGPYTLIGSTRDPYFLDNGARNGISYYYAVSAYDFEGNESALCRDVAYDIPRPEGYDVLINDFHLSPNTAGYDFSDYLVVPYDDLYADIWYEYYLGGSYMVVSDDTDIQDMGPTNSILDVKIAPANGWSPTHDVVLRPGHTYVVWTWDDHYAKFRVTALSPGRVVFDWAYQLQESNPLMKRSVTERKPRVLGNAVEERGGTLSRD